MPATAQPVLSPALRCRPCPYKALPGSADEVHPGHRTCPAGGEIEMLGSFIKFIDEAPMCSFMGLRQHRGTDRTCSAGGLPERAARLPRPLRDRAARARASARAPCLPARCRSPARAVGTHDCAALCTLGLRAAPSGPPAGLAPPGTGPECPRIGLTRLASQGRGGGRGATA